MTGTILKGVGGFYTILGTDGAEYVCHARGRFRLEDMSPLPGDRVEFTCAGEERDNRILSLLPRKNELVRPAVANIDKLIIVVALTAPKPDLLLVDKLLLQCAAVGITPVLVMNKCENCDEELERGIAAQYENAGCALISASAVTGEGLEPIKAEIRGCVCCFAGQSAVGKTSLLNALVPGMEQEVGGLSRKTERGRHTTRHAQLWQAFGGVVADTPGFSLLDAAEMEPEKLWQYYPEMSEYGGLCRFPECMHMSEPECAVKPLLENGALSRGRYERYIQIAQELKEKRKHRYD